MAKVSGEWHQASALGYGAVSFVFAWGSPSDKYAVINVESLVSLNGTCLAWADAAFWGNFSDLIISTHLEVIEYWNRPPTSAPPESTQDATVVELQSHSGWLGDYERASLGGVYDLLYNQFILPPRGVAVFGVTVSAGTWIDSGFTSFDLASGDFEVRCPALIIGILT